MSDGNNKINFEKNFLGECVCKISNVGNVFQPIWIRHDSIFTFIFDRKFVERKFSFVLFVGSLLWVGFFLSKIL